MEKEDITVAGHLLGYLRRNDNRVNADDIQEFWDEHEIGQGSKKRLKIKDYLKALGFLQESENRYWYSITPEGLKAESQGLENRLRTETLVEELESILSVPNPTLGHGSDTTRRALTEVDNAVRTGNVVSAVDRVHTALHGYVLDVCRAAGLAHDLDAPVTKLFKLLRANHPSFLSDGVRADDVDMIMRSSASMVDSFNTIRNRASLAHPGPLLDAAEAFLVVNSCRTLLHYLDMKLRSASSNPLSVSQPVPTGPS